VAAAVGNAGDLLAIDVHQPDITLVDVRMPPGSPTKACAPRSPSAVTSRRSGSALPGEDLLSQDVGVPAVLGEFAQDVEVHPAQRERAAPVAVDPVVQPQG
jgi:hypothetical protein